MKLAPVFKAPRFGASPPSRRSALEAFLPRNTNFQARRFRCASRSLHPAFEAPRFRDAPPARRPDVEAPPLGGARFAVERPASEAAASSRRLCSKLRQVFLRNCARLTQTHGRHRIYAHMNIACRCRQSTRGMKRREAFHIRTVICVHVYSFSAGVFYLKHVCLYVYICNAKY